MDDASKTVYSPIMYRKVSVCTWGIYNLNSKRNTRIKKYNFLGEIQEEMHYLSMGDISNNDFMQKSTKTLERKERKGKERKNKKYSLDPRNAR